MAGGARIQTTDPWCGHKEHTGNPLNGDMRPRSTCDRINVTLEFGEQLMIRCRCACVKHGGGSVMVWVCMAAKATGSPVFMDDVPVGKSSGMNLASKSFN